MEVISAKEIGYNWQSWNQLQNTYNLKVYNNDIDYPKSLISKSLKMINDECKRYGINISRYKYIQITKRDSTYQVDLFQNKECIGACLSLYDIYFFRTILQACFTICG